MRSMQSSAPIFTVPAEVLSAKSGAFECILGESVANRPWTTEWMASFTSSDVGSESSATYMGKLCCLGIFSNSFLISCMSSPSDLKSSVRGASATPPRNACISGETRRGFMIPRTGLFFVSDAGFEEAAKLTVRAGCRLAKGGAASLTEDGDTDGFNNVAVSPVTKPENIPKDRAIMPELWIG
nr:hypothetical protein Iba_chr06cCG4820 [Ipomoea batatas]